MIKHVRHLICKCFEAEHEVLGLDSFPTNSSANKLSLCPWVHGLSVLQVDVFLSGSVPLRTYLPDGDIDLVVFKRAGPEITATWNGTLHAFLVLEQSRQRVCRITDVQNIDAEVRELSCKAGLLQSRLSIQDVTGMLAGGSTDASDSGSPLRASMTCLC